jgi:hypothetical protein
MKTLRLSFLVLFSLLVSLITLFYFFGEDNQPSATSSELFRLGQDRSAPAQRISFDRNETSTAYELTYGWKDFKGELNTVSFPLSKQQLAEAEAEFGYYPDELDKFLEENLQKRSEEMMSHLERFASQQVLLSKYSRYITMDKVSPKDFNLKVSAPASLSKEAKEEFDRIMNEITTEREAYLERIEKEQEKKRKEFLENRGFRFTGDSMGVNYRLVVYNNSPRVKQVVETMREKFRKKSLQQFLALMLAFIQQVRYGLPPLEEKNRVILEFWVPPKVLVSNFGDCDSKGVTFASMWTNFKKYPFVLIKIPKHLFVGVAVPSIGGEGFTINGIRYTLCEVTGPDLIPPGLITQYSLFYLQGGNYRYELIN